MTPVFWAAAVFAGVAIALGGPAAARLRRWQGGSPAPAGRPTEYPWPRFRRLRGAYRTTAKAVNAHLAAVRPVSEPTFKLAGLLLSAERELNRLILLTGRPDAGKTTLLLAMLADLARLWVTHPGFRQRWLFLDPVGLLPHLYRIVPPHIDIIRGTPDDADGLAWDAAADVQSEADVLVLGSCLFGDEIVRQAADRFWPQMAREKFEDCVRVFRYLGSDWGIWDPIIAIKYPQFLAPLLAQCPYTRGAVSTDLTGRMGKGITASARAVLNEMAVAASLWRQARRRFGVRSFLETQAVLHLQFTPRLSKVVSGLFGAATNLFSNYALERKDKTDHSVGIFDEARFMGGLAGGLLGDVAARGRGAGLHAVVSTQAVAPLRKLLGPDGFEEFIDLIGTWVCLSSGPFTGKLFADVCGDMEGEQDSTGTSVSEGETAGRSGGHTWSSGPGGGGSSTSNGWSVSHSVTYGTSTTTAVGVKAAILRGEVGHAPFADPAADRICGHFFNPGLGCGAFTTDFLTYFRGLPPAPFADYPRRPREQELLQPWTESECRDRLRLHSTPELREALRLTWEQFEQEDRT